MPLENRVAVVTGSSRGIGKAIAEELAKRGARVALTARDQSALDNTASLIRAAGGTCLAVKADITCESACISVLDEVRKQFGKVEILVNNAGIYRTAQLEGHPSNIWNETIQTNLTAAFILCREALPDMLKNEWGRIINISSISGKTAEMYGAAYSASKFGLIGLTQAIALEVATKGITANAVCPGWVSTEMAEKQLSSPDWCKLNDVEQSQSQEMARYSIPQQRFIQPAEVAQLVSYLCSDAAKGITGQALNICGGMCLS